MGGVFITSALQSSVMTFVILTLFPDLIAPILSGSVLGRAQKNGTFTVKLRNLRDWATDKHHTVDDAPYGGGAGMVLRVDVIDRALADLKTEHPEAEVILLTPQGKRFSQEIAEELSETGKDVIILAGHYEGFDERVRALVDRQISVGDYVLTGGELPAAIVVDAVARLLPGVLDEASPTEESHSLKDETGQRLLEYPHYTRPDTYEPTSKPAGKLAVPEILKSGNHAKIAAWRREQAKRRTTHLSVDSKE